MRDFRVDTLQYSEAQTLQPPQPNQDECLSQLMEIISGLQEQINNQNGLIQQLNITLQQEVERGDALAQRVAELEAAAGRGAE